MSKFDIVIPCHPKDSQNLRQVIKSLKNLSNKGDVYIISPEVIDLQIKEEYKCINDSEFDDLFTIQQIKDRWIQKDSQFAYRSSWVYQQLLKLFCHRKIENLTDSFLLLDSDTMILRDIDFDVNKFQYCIASENHIPYKVTYKNMTGFEAENFSFIYHHMMFNKKYLDEFIDHVETLHKSSFFDALLNCMSYDNQSPFSEWDSYGNWVYRNHNDVCKQRQLKARNLNYIPNDFQMIQMSSDFDIVSSHAWMRGVEAK